MEDEYLLHERRLTDLSEQVMAMNVRMTDYLQVISDRSEFYRTCQKLWSDKTIKVTLRTRDMVWKSSTPFICIGNVHNKHKQRLQIRIRHKYMPATQRQSTVQ
ncbi:hypothetical protein OUZ56_024685 [Daphnia magna]|uniref:Uncharacterized protein n=1 Tax=Daphnia magna TaxID=35525 RepID=A0ABR0B1H0_9CRUS|nr:hypothetical protein OUZ56_024685 [Daphnia magna]